MLYQCACGKVHDSVRDIDPGCYKHDWVQRSGVEMIIILSRQILELSRRVAELEGKGKKP